MFTREEVADIVQQVLQRQAQQAEEDGLSDDGDPLEHASPQRWGVRPSPQPGRFRFNLTLRRSRLASGWPHGVHLRTTESCAQFA